MTDSGITSLASFPSATPDLLDVAEMRAACERFEEDDGELGPSYATLDAYRQVVSPERVRGALDEWQAAKLRAVGVRAFAFAVGAVEAMHVGYGRIFDLARAAAFSRVAHRLTRQLDMMLGDDVLRTELPASLEASTEDLLLVADYLENALPRYHEPYARPVVTWLRAEAER